MVLFLNTWDEQLFRVSKCVPLITWAFVILIFCSFFLEILCFFFVPHYTRQILKKSDAKRNDHVFPKLNEPSWFLQIFVLENNIFHIFIFCFPIDTSMKLFIIWFSNFFYLFPDWYNHETHFACNEEPRHRGHNSTLEYLQAHYIIAKKTSHLAYLTDHFLERKKKE